MGRLGQVGDVFPVSGRSRYKLSVDSGLRRWVDSLATAQEGASGVHGLALLYGGETLAGAFV